MTINININCITSSASSIDFTQIEWLRVIFAWKSWHLSIINHGNSNAQTNTNWKQRLNKNNNNITHKTHFVCVESTSEFQHNFAHEPHKYIDDCVWRKCYCCHCSDQIFDIIHRIDCDAHLLTNIWHEHLWKLNHLHSFMRKFI